MKSVKLRLYGHLEEVDVKYSSKQIKKRRSYNFWKPIIQETKNLPIKYREKISTQIWQQMNDAHKFGSEKQSEYELESLAFCLLEIEGKI
jgi:hypothetical protein